MNPARAGEPIEIYIQISAVSSSSSAPLGSPTPALAIPGNRVRPAVFVGGKLARLLFFGLVPGSADLYSVGVLMPTDVGSGGRLPAILMLEETVMDIGPIVVQ